MELLKAEGIALQTVAPIPDSGGIRRTSLTRTLSDAATVGPNRLAANRTG